MSKKKVVIIGCGFSGGSAALQLDKHPNVVDLTVLTKRENFLLMKYGGLRAATADGNWVKRAMVPLSNLLKNGKVVHGSVTSIDHNAKTVSVENGQTYPYDVLLIASGTRNFSPGEPPLNASSKEATEAYYSQMHKALTETKNVVLVGSGPVAIELAGEITKFGQKDVKISLVTRSPHVLHGPEPLTKSNIASMENLLIKEKIEIHYNDEVVSETLPADLHNAVPIVHTPNGVRLKSGKEIKCDLMVYTLGSKVNTSFVPREWLDERTHEVLVNEKTLQSTVDPNMFCVGDAAKLKYTKLGYYATEDGKIAAANILQLCQGKQPTNHITRYSMMLAVPFGPSKGRVLLSFMNLGNWFASMVKGGGLYANTTWGMYAPGLRPPPPQ